MNRNMKDCNAEFQMLETIKARKIVILGNKGSATSNMQHMAHLTRSLNFHPLVYMYIYTWAVPSINF